LAAQVAALSAQLAELKAKPAEPAPPPAAEEKPEAPPPVYSDDEQAVLNDYLKEWPDVARGESLQRRQEYGQLVAHIFAQLQPRLEALEQGVSRTSTRTQYQDIVELVPDYDAVRDPTLAWIETQPDYLKNAYKQVAQQGSPKDVADLITRFKKETGYAAPAAAATPPAGTPAPAAPPAAGATAATKGAVAAKTVPALSPQAAAAANALKSVKSSRSEPVSTPDPDDFDAAFKEFASQA
jgi:hypothetical protein